MQDSLQRDLIQPYIHSARGMVETCRCLICVCYCILEHAGHAGQFSEGFNAALDSFCPWIGGDLQVFDMNGDGYDDLICHTSDGRVHISESHIVVQQNSEIEEGNRLGNNTHSETVHQTGIQI